MGVVLKLSFLQFIVTVVFAAAMAYFKSYHYAVSALVGGSICCIANGFFAARLFVGSNVGDEPKQLLRHFYRSEALKILFTLAMFVLVLKLTGVAFMPFIIAYALAALANWAFLPFLN